jgi:hypothetical protein
VLQVEELETRLVPNAPSAAPSLGPPPPPGPGITWVNSESALQNAVTNLQSNQTIVIEPGTYTLSSTLYIGLNTTASNVLIRGSTDNYGDVVLLGQGMDNANYGNVPFGFAVYNAQNVTITDLAVGAVYYDPIELQGNSGAQQVHLYHDHFFDAGEQFVKSNPNPAGGGVNNSTVEYCVLEYTNGPPVTDHGGGTGYTNGVDVHAGKGWLIADNLFQNFHTPDTDANLWNPAVLIWNHSANATVEGNTFINTDRAIAFGLYVNPPSDNQGGIIRNNFVYMTPGLFSSWRTAHSDAQIIVWDSPKSAVFNNTVLTSGNTVQSIQVRFSSTTNIPIRDNLTDAPIGARDGASFISSGNYVTATPSMFVNPSSGDLHLVSNNATLAYVIDKVSILPRVPDDWDDTLRPVGLKADIGADEYDGGSPLHKATLNAPIAVASDVFGSPSPQSRGEAPLFLGTDWAGTNFEQQRDGPTAANVDNLFAADPHVTSGVFVGGH